MAKKNNANKLRYFFMAKDTYKSKIITRKYTCIEKRPKYIHLEFYYASLDKNKTLAQSKQFELRTPSDVKTFFFFQRERCAISSKCIFQMSVQCKKSQCSSRGPQCTIVQSQCIVMHLCVLTNFFIIGSCIRAVPQFEPRVGSFLVLGLRNIIFAMTNV